GLGPALFRFGVRARVARRIPGPAARPAGILKGSRNFGSPRRLTRASCHDAPGRAAGHRGASFTPSKTHPLMTSPMTKPPETRAAAESPRIRVAPFLAARASAYCADCTRARLSLGRSFTAARLVKEAAAFGLVFEKPATCDCCRRSRTVLRAAQGP